MAEAVVGLLVRALERQLRMIETGLDQRARQFLADPDAGGDEVGVEPALRRVSRELDDIAPRGRLAAREVDVQRAERRRLAEDALPRLACRARRRGVRAPPGWSSAGSRAGSDGSARPECRSAAACAVICLQNPLGLEVAEHGDHVLLDHGRRRIVAGRQLRDDRCEITLAVAELQHRRRRCVDLEDPLRRKQRPALADVVAAEL